MARLGRFARDEEGSGIILTLFIFMFMLVMAGLGIDTMRQEMERTRLQATLDAAVLAGAGAPVGTEVTEIKAIVEDYFEKSDMASYLHEINTDGEGEDEGDIVTSLNHTRVYAEASMNIDTYLMKLSGVDTLGAAGAAAAEVRTPKLEVSLVLDVSGSMAGTKLTKLQSAARSFVTTILNGSDPGDTVISVVPFAWTVTPGEDIYNALTVNETHDYSTCLRFSGSDYNDAGIDPDSPVDQQIFTALYGDFDDLDEDWRSCYPESRAEILPFSMNEADLHAHINALDADGNTSAHIGMKWGAAMLDPDFEDVFEDLKTAGVVDASLSNLPTGYTEPESLKIIVLMADGQNTTSYYFDANSEYRGPNSDLYLMKYQEMEFQYAYKKHRKGGLQYSYNESKCNTNDWTCVYEATGEEVSAYYLRDGNDYYDIEERDWIDDDDYDDIKESDGFISETRLSWEQAWGLMSPRYYSEITGNWNAWNDYVGSEYENGSTKDARMQAICSATKARNVIVYTIGYSISSGGNAETQLRNCASSTNHYYPTNGENIAAAFNSIASNVQNLRLTQ
ncbi:TadE/TadG family type IV pilus assembly protein [Roseovarius amoyensis]|uniref:TadE/TadG family type IV pilus assembly protein n=1 Tax=Roseovarius amoyensis TaxID=2211448 RepID=UPI000DBE43FE|nr:TadE/TadG family type IV pilus assembly protein [Roseovarius amoyensis]